MNTHKGFFRPIRLQFCVHSTSLIFQRELENRVTHVRFNKVHSEDILISGENDKENLENLKQILRIIQANGLPFKLGKGVCMCVSLYTCVCAYFFTIKASSVCNDIWDILEGADQRSSVVSIILGAPAKFRHLRF